MQITFTQDSCLTIPCDVLILPIFEDETILHPFFSEIDELLNGHVSSIIKRAPDCSSFGHLLPLYTLGKMTPQVVLLAGSGKAKELTLDKIRSLSAIVMRKIVDLHYHSAMPLFFSFEKINSEFRLEKIVQAVIEGTILGTYEFNYYKTEPQKLVSLTTIYFAYSDALQHETLLQSANKAVIIANAVNNTRNLVNHPPQYMTPSRMAQYAEHLAAQYHFDSQILDQDQMKAEQMHALLAVARGSSEPPKMIILTYKGDPDSSELTALIGKGITFDSGGISIKPSENMCEMKDDMAGGAAVLGAMEAIGQLRPKTNVIAVIPCTENMPSGNALKPGDVISSQKGSTIEIISTDAEGRLILADAVNHAIKLGVTRIIDVATLTGACITALGNVASGVLTNNEAWWEMLKSASLSTGEKMWRLPLFEEYKEQIKSDIADLKNTGGRPAGTITAGLFIAHFAANTPWLHIDIAGTANSDKENGYNVKGASGVGVRTLVELIQRLAHVHGI
ncbi:MAG: cytosol aminopeptidase [Firmicutes bacterium]|nr:cytosol aminopeptidase [Bacillota bacterium]